MKSLVSRIWPILCFVLTFSVLFTAYQLEPDVSGMGTHQQLGLEPCGFLTFVGIPCMMCGMTTSFSLYMNIQILDGFNNQPFSVIIFAGTVFTLILAALDIIDPRRRLLRFIDTLQQADRKFYIGLLLLFFSSWILKIIMHTL